GWARAYHAMRSVIQSDVEPPHSHIAARGHRRTEKNQRNLGALIFDCLSALSFPWSAAAKTPLWMDTRTPGDVVVHPKRRRAALQTKNSPCVPLDCVSVVSRAFDVIGRGPLRTMRCQGKHDPST